MRLRIELEGIAPPVWRRLTLDNASSLARLHRVIQAAMGWGDDQLHAFHIGGKTYGVPHADGPRAKRLEDEGTAVLGRVLMGVRDFEYVYDFGDAWRHRITVERGSRAAPESIVHGFVEAGERACPPEQSGGPRGYQAFLDAWKADRRGEDVRAFLAWAGQDFDPERFDRPAANAALTRTARWEEG
jgi:hypothetical protein